MGRFMTHVRHKGTVIANEFHILPSPCAAVIGRDLIQQLSLHIEGATMKVSALIAHNHHVLCDFLRLLSDELCMFPDYEHVITVTDDAMPSAKKLRPVPLSRGQATEKEVALMDKVGIWEKVNKSQWVHQADGV
ncbi:transposon Ty3-G Gag-Pol polyprotein [Elysia marginata]|uniref:Transposon Ty3-G Gag-Pol polyprotein n=1 Tax=Elysia marginata TaxID=1093978 RepID=A0AAV4JM96_9GAST|nr:transposon Ty3-G Gag-Pol polyprotein [Elysia marginata]